MPFPPPPPPPGPPPPPTFLAAPSPTPSVDSQGRNLLLQSIRQGTALKKTVTVDRSTPQGAGKKLKLFYVPDVFFFICFVLYVNWSLLFINFYYHKVVDCFIFK